MPVPERMIAIKHAKMPEISTNFLISFIKELDSGRGVRIYGAGHPMIGTVLMLFFGLPSIIRSLYAT